MRTHNDREVADVSQKRCVCVWVKVSEKWLRKSGSSYFFSHQVSCVSWAVVIDNYVHNMFVIIIIIIK